MAKRAENGTDEDDMRLHQRNGPMRESSSTGSSDSALSRHKQFKSHHTVAMGKQQQSDENSLNIERSDHFYSLLDEGRPVSHRDILICTLQEHLKKMEDMYKKKLDDSQALREKFCKTTQELTDVKKICYKFEEENKKLRDKKEDAPDKPDPEKWRKEYEELVTNVVEDKPAAMRQFLDDNDSTPVSGLDLNKLIQTYKIIENTLTEHTKKFDLLAEKLNLQFEQKKTESEEHTETVTDKYLENSESSHSKNETAITKSKCNTRGDCSTRILMNITNKSPTKIEDQVEELQDHPSKSKIINEELVGEFRRGKEIYDGELSRFRDDNQRLRREIEEKTRVVEEYVSKVTEFEVECGQLKKDLAKAMSDRDCSLEELMKIQCDINEGGQTLKHCLCDLNSLKEENMKNMDNEKRLQEENDGLRKKLDLVEQAIDEYKEELELTEIQCDNLKQKEENAVECICKLRDEYNEREKEYTEQKQEYEDMINDLKSSEETLKTRVRQTRSLEENYTGLQNKCGETARELENKNKLLVELLEKMEMMEYGANESAEQMKKTVDELRAKYEKTNEDLSATRETVNALETDFRNLQVENTKLKKDLTSADTKILEYKHIQEAIEDSLAAQNRLMDQEKKRVEQEIDEAKILSNCLEEQLKQAKEKYEKILPLACGPCYQDMNDVVAWLRRENLALRAAQNTLIDNLQNKLTESRKQNNFDAFLVSKEILNTVLDIIGTTNNDNLMPDRLKQSFENVLGNTNSLENKIGNENAKNGEELTTSEQNKTDLVSLPSLVAQDSAGNFSRTSSKSFKKLTNSETIIEEDETPADSKSQDDKPLKSEEADDKSLRSVEKTDEILKSEVAEALEMENVSQTNSQNVNNKNSFHPSNDIKEQPASSSYTSQGKFKSLSSPMLDRAPSIYPCGYNCKPDASTKISIPTKISYISCEALKKIIIPADIKKDRFLMPQEQTGSKVCRRSPLDNCTFKSSSAPFLEQICSKLNVSSEAFQTYRNNKKLLAEIKPQSTSQSCQTSQGDVRNFGCRYSPEDTKNLQPVIRGEVVSDAVSTCESMTTSEERIIEFESVSSKTEVHKPQISKNTANARPEGFLVRDRLNDHKGERSPKPKTISYISTRHASQKPVSTHISKVPIKTQHVRPKVATPPSSRESKYNKALQSAVCEQSKSIKISQQQSADKVGTAASSKSIEVEIKISQCNSCQGIIKYGSTMEEQLNNLSKMEKQVGNLRRELSANRTISIPKDIKLNDEELHRRLKIVKIRKDKLLADLGKIPKSYRNNSTSQGQTRSSRKDIARRPKTPKNNYN